MKSSKVARKPNRIRKINFTCCLCSFCTCCSGYIYNKDCT